jgi:hypothetical protein
LIKICKCVDFDRFFFNFIYIEDGFFVKEATVVNEESKKYDKEYEDFMKQLETEKEQ